MNADPYFDTEHHLLREQLTKFVEKEICPNGDAWEEQGYIPRELLRHMGELGFLGLNHSAEYGGSGLDIRAAVVLAEALAHSTYGGVTITTMVHTNMASPHLANAGNNAQKAKYIPDFVAGNKISAIAVTEPGAGSDVAGIRTHAKRDGDDWVINGSKMFITNGVHGDVFFVAARTDPEAKGSRGISIFIVEKGTEGFSVGRTLKKHGWHSSDTAELFFDNVRVPHSDLLGEENRGFYAIMKNFQHERIVLAAQALGEAQKALDLTLEYVKQRRAFGGVLFDNASVRQKLAAAQSRISMARAFTYQVAWLDAQGQDCIKEVSMLKAEACEIVNRVMYDCVQLHGGMGFMRETAVERMSRDARVLSIGGGATEVMYEEVAKRL